MTTTPTQAPTSTDLQTPAVDERRLSAATGMDAVTLRVGDLEKMSKYYSNALAMEPLEETARDGEVHRVL
ncbi:VOC family protein, partial [Micrococcus sp. SIMBA_144]